MLKKSQAWYADFLIGLLILIFITFVFTTTIIDLNTKEDKLQELSNDGISVSSSLMSSAYGSYGSWIIYPPSGRLGFVKNGRIIKEDFEEFQNLVNSDEGYKNSKILLGTKNDYILYFEFNDEIFENKVYGKPGININNNKIEGIISDNIIKITRIVYYDLDNSGKIVKMVILIF